MNLIDQATKQRWLILQNGSILLPKKNKLYFDADNVLNIKSDFIKWFELGNLDGMTYLAAEVNSNFKPSNQMALISLREALFLLPVAEYSIGVKAYSVLHWDRSHQFCGRCGEKTLPQGKQFERVCDTCQVSFFPRISPSIIVLIHRDDELIMARSPYFPPGVYGLIAGFVEVGETLEEAVHREVKEEIGVQIKNITYVGSQPWPFPDTLMLAFTAEYASGEITIDQDEIEAAAWYRYDNLPGRPSMKMSIASKILDDFIVSCEGNKR